MFLVNIGWHSIKFYELNKLAEIIREISYVSQTLNGVLVTNKKEDATNTYYSMSASQMADAKVQEAMHRGYMSWMHLQDGLERA